MDATNATTDSELMARACGGDIAAFEAIYGRHETRVYAYLLRLTRDESAAADLRQEAFFRLWQAREEWKNEGSVAGYLIGVARNLAVDGIRRQRVHERWRESETREPATTALSPDDVLANEELSRRVRAAIDALPDRPREVFVLKRDAGLAYNEIAALLDISPKTVEAHMSKALRLLRETLSDLRERLTPG